MIRTTNQRLKDFQDVCSVAREKAMLEHYAKAVEEEPTIKVEFYDIGAEIFDSATKEFFVNRFSMSNINQLCKKYVTSKKNSTCYYEYGRFSQEMGVFTERPKKVYLSKF